MGHRIEGTFRLHDEAEFNQAVTVCWGLNVKCCPNPGEPKELQFTVDSDDEQKLLAALQAVNDEAQGIVRAPKECDVDSRPTV